MLLGVLLCLIDEVHLLNQEERGATLEAVVARMKLLKKFQYNVRFIAVSATVPNLQDVGVWLEAKVFKFGNEYRSCPLEISVQGYNPARSPYLFENHLKFKLKDIITRFSSCKPSLIFCTTQKGTENAAKQLCEDFKFQLVQKENQQQALQAESANLQNKALQQIILQGIGFHHASLHVDDRTIVEKLFSQGDLKVICTTSTLAMGVNLPAHLVYRGNGYSEITSLELFQMIGRAGRPQYDNQGVAVIMTEKDKVQMYERMVSCKEEIESRLSNSITEHLNSEIALESIQNMDSAVQWLKSTFMYVRAQQKESNQSQIEDTIKSIIQEQFQQLSEYDLALSSENSSLIQSTSLGKTVSNYCIKFETVKLWKDLCNA